MNIRFYNRFLLVLLAVSIQFTAQAMFNACSTASDVRDILNKALIADDSKISSLADGINAIKAAGKKITELGGKSKAVTIDESNVFTKWTSRLLGSAKEWWSEFICERTCCGYLDIVIVRETKKAYKEDDTINIKNTVDDFVALLENSDVKSAESQLFRKDNDNGFLNKYAKDSESVKFFVNAFNLSEAKKEQEGEEAKLNTALKNANKGISTMIGGVKSLWTKLASAWGQTEQTVDALDLK